MFFYLCLIVACHGLILLPEPTPSGCKVDTIWAYFDALDKNKDSGIDKPEAYAAFRSVDLNGDDTITILELKLAAPLVALALIGKEAEVIYFLDLNKDGMITFDDVEKNYEYIDLDKNGIKSEKEYEDYIPKRCGPVYPGP